MKKPSVKEWVLNVFYPKRCLWCDGVIGFAKQCACDAPREALSLGAGPLPARFSKEEACFGLAWACYLYAEPVRGAIHRMKFEGEKALAPWFAQKLAQRYFEAGLGELYDVLVPVPSSGKTIKMRKYNQSVLLAQCLAALTGKPCDENLLRKVRDTAPQMTLNREGRLSNLENAFEASEAARGLRVLLIDDIITTGSTLNECAKTLLKAGAACCGALCVASAEAK